MSLSIQPPWDGELWYIITHWHSIPIPIGLMGRFVYLPQLQLFGSKVILAATHEQALLFPWERGWAGGQFDLVKFVSRSIEKNGPYIPVKCVWWSVHGTKTKRSNTEHHKNLEQFTQMISTPSIQLTGWVGWELFVLGSSIQYISPKWQLRDLKPKEQSVNITTEQLIHESLPFQTVD